MGMVEAIFSMMSCGDPATRAVVIGPGLRTLERMRRSVSADRLVESVKVGQIGDIALNAADVVADLLHGVVEFLLAASRDEDIGSFRDEEFCRGKPDPGRSSGDDRYFSLQLAHAYRSDPASPSAAIQHPLS
jgi:hypothetical protein